MEMRGLDMQQPKSLTVTRDGKVEDLKAMLKPATIIGHQAWRAVYEVKQPGVYQFAMEPAPISIPRKTASSSTIPRLSWLLLATRKAGMFLWG